MRKKIALFVLLIVVLIGASIQWIICGNVLMCNISLNDARRVLLSWLIIEDTDGGMEKKGVLLIQNSPLGKIIGNGFRASFDEMMESNRFSVTIKREYYVGGRGSETVIFDVTPVDAGRVQIKVDYLDYGTSFFLPYIFWNPGLLKERKILKTLEAFINERNLGNDRDI